MPSPPAPLSEPFARVLRASREELNARFAEARQRLSALDAGVFGEFLRDAVDPLVSVVEAACPGSAESTALAAYDAALELVGQQLVGAAGRSPAIYDTWRRVLPAAARIVAMEPARVLASLSNAAYHLDATPGVSVHAWTDDMTRLAGECTQVEDLLRVGQVAAWRAGQAHFRKGAIAAAALLPEPLALRAVGAPPSARWAEVEAGLGASEWFDPARPATAHERGKNGPPRRVAMVGAFRGLGGAFLVPPCVTYSDRHFHVLSGEECWMLTADLFGATFHRVAPDAPRPPVPGRKLPAGVGSLEGPGTMTSAAASDTTLAVTWSLTHQVMLLALA